MTHSQAVTSSPDPRQSYFDQLAPRWDRVGPDPALTIERLDTLRPRLGLAPGMNVVEIGCGTGQVTGWLLDQVRPGHLVAVDFSEGMLAEARRRGVDARFITHDICAEPLPGGPFDVAFCFHAFPHFRDPRIALRHLAQVLTPGGRLLVLHLSGSEPLNSFHASLEGAVQGDRLPAASEWPGLLGDAGLELCAVTDQADLFLLEAVRDRSPHPSPSHHPVKNH
jgi:ubiquinone/menaquinone biosynthesis C-methylase UbiE